MLAALASMLLWVLLTPGKALAGTPQPPPQPDTPDIFLVDASAVQPAAEADRIDYLRSLLHDGEAVSS